MAVKRCEKCNRRLLSTGKCIGCDLTYDPNLAQKMMEKYGNHVYSLDCLKPFGKSDVQRAMEECMLRPTGPGVLGMTAEEIEREFRG